MEQTRPRPCRPDETGRMAAIVNAAAQAYRGVIPEDCWHEPYMPLAALRREIAAGVEFWGCEAGGELVAVMGVQPVKDVALIRHAYTAPGHQGQGIGAALLHHLKGLTGRPLLVGTWAAAEWAIRFYQRHGFALAAPQRKDELLKTYWTISHRQVATSVVLVDERFPLT